MPIMRTMQTINFQLKKQVTFKLKEILLIVALVLSIVSSNAQVTVTEVDQNIPTYLSGAPEPNPMFFSEGAARGQNSGFILTRCTTT